MAALLCKKMKRALLPSQFATGTRWIRDLGRRSERSRYACRVCAPSEGKPNNNQPWVFHSRLALEKHSKKKHGELLADKARYELCRVCGSCVEKDVEKCCFLMRDEETPCPRKSKISAREIDATLKQQYGDRKKKIEDGGSDEDDGEGEGEGSGSDGDGDDGAEDDGEDSEGEGEEEGENSEGDDDEEDDGEDSKGEGEEDDDDEEEDGDDKKEGK